MKRIKKFLYPLGLVIGLVIFFAQFVQAFDPLRAFIKEPNFLLVLISILFIALAVLFFQTYNWQLILKSLGYSLSLALVQEGYVLSSLPKYIPGSIWGYLSRGEWLFRKAKVPFSVTLCASTLEIILAIFSSIWLTCLFILFYVPLSSLWWRIILILFLPWLFWMTIRQIAKTLHTKWASVNVFFSGFVAITFPDWLRCAGVFCIQWILLGAIPSAMLLQLGSTSSNGLLFDFLATVSMNSLAWVIGLVMVLFPTGLGVREYTLSVLLNGIFRLSESHGLMISIISRFAIMLSELTWLIFFLIKEKTRQLIHKDY